MDIQKFNAQKLVFEWDESKAVTNLKKHGIDFRDARSAFLDLSAILLADDEHSGDEDRYILLGMSVEIRALVVVCHCYPESEGITRIRIISARQSTKHEYRLYQER